MPITAAQATAQLASIETPEQLRALIAQLDISAGGTTTVLYSGKLPNSGGADAAARAVAADDPSIRILDNTEAAKFLNLKANTVLAARLEQIVGGDPAVDGTASSRFLYGTYDADGHRITADGIWDDVSGRFAAATTGDVRVIAHRVDPAGIFGATELKKLLETGAVTSIEGVPLSELKAIEAKYGAEGLHQVLRRVGAASEFNIAASGLTSTLLPEGSVAVGVGDFLSPQLLDTQAYLIGRPEAHARVDAYINGLSESERAERRGLAQALMQADEGVRLSGGTRLLNRLGVFGTVFSFALAANAAEAAQTAGDTERAKEIMKLWAVDAAGSEVGSMVGVAVGGMAVAAAAVAGVALSAPLAGAIVLGGALVGGIFGAEGAVEFYRLLDDRDKNTRLDIVDRLCNLLFGATSTITAPLPADLNGARYSIDASLTRDEMVSQARDNVAWRYALRELNSFVVADVSYDRHNADGSLDLYDEATGAGAMTDRFLADRAAMLAWKIRFEVDGARDDNDAARSGPKPYNENWDSSSIQGNWDFVDLTTRLPGGQPLNLSIDGAGVSTHDHQVVFGSVGAETIDGEGDSDWLYGLDGADTVNGEDGNDHLEGNAGNDSLSGGAGGDTLVGGRGNDTLEGGGANDTMCGGTGEDAYRFSAGWAYDTVSDADGIGTIHVVGIGDITGASSVKLAEGTWRSADGRVYFTLVPVDAGSNDLYVSFSDRPDVIRVQGWSEAKSLGITLPGTIAPPPPPAYIATADFDKATSGSGYLLTSVGYQSAGPLPGAADILLGTVGTDSLSGLLGNDGLYGSDGADLIDGGEGSDLLLGGTGADTITGGAGADVIFGSAVGGIERPTSTDFVPPASAGEEVARGFSWVAYRAAGGRWQDGQAVLRFMGVGGAIASPGWMEGGQLQVESDGNVIDAGAGNDYVAAGTGDDIVRGGDDDDDIVGMDGRDRLFGDAGADFIWGDGPQGVNETAFTPLDRHGGDILSGGAGNDVLAGQGGNDELYGGTEDDKLWGDDPNLTDTPASLHGADYLDGGDGADELVGGGLDDELRGGTGDDRLWGDGGQAGQVPDAVQGADHLAGEDGDDHLIGGGADDVLLGGAGADQLHGDDTDDRLAASAHGADLLDGGTGNDTLVGGGHDDQLFGGDGNDGLHGDDLPDDPALAEHGDDVLDGGAGDDTLLGDAGNDVLLGGLGADYLQSDTGNDTLDGGSGTDYLAGGAGDDTYVFAAGDRPLNAAGAAEAIADTEGVNRVVFETGNADDTSGIAVSASGSTLFVVDGAGDTLAVLGGIAGGVGTYRFGDGTELGHAELIGRFSESVLSATDDGGQQYALGGRGDDAVVAGGGAATLAGGRGNDSLSATGGGNTYLFHRGDGHDTITDTAGLDPLTGLPLPTSRVEFGSGIGASDITLRYDGTLVLELGANSGDVLRIGGFDAGNALGGSTNIDRFVFADGSELSHAQLLARGFDQRGTDGNDAIAGTSADDRFDGGVGNDTQSGGAGADSYAFGAGAGQDLIDDAGGNGSADTLRLAAGTTAADVMLYRSGNDLVVRLRNTADQATVLDHFAGSGAGVESLVFSDGTTWDRSAIGARVVNELTDSADTYTATAGNDAIDGRGGNDTLRAGAGNDSVDGGSGNDSLLGEDGDDLLSGGIGADTLDGGNGVDLLDGRSDSASDSMRGGSGADIYFFGRGSGADAINDGGADAASVDVLRLDAGISPMDVRLTGRYPITLSIIGTADSISFGPDTGNSRIERIEFADGTVWGRQQWEQRALLDSATEGNDSLTAFSSTDSVTMWGLGGNDTLTAYGGGDTLDGGAGTDRLSAGSGNDSASGGADNDSIDGFAGNDTLDGGAGTDSLYGGDGDDLLANGETMQGGLGTDRYVIDEWPTATATIDDAGGGGDVVWLPGTATPGVVRANVAYSSASGGYDALSLTLPGSYAIRVDGFFSSPAADSIEELRFLDGTVWTRADILAGIPSNNLSDADDQSIVGFRWNDILDARGGNDSVSGKLGDDRIEGGAGHDTLYGNEGSDTLSGGAGNDLVYGDSYQTTYTGDGADSLSGGDGKDTLYGAGGDDTLGGGGGSDLVYGGDGNDTYAIDRDSGRETVADSGGVDRMLLSSDISPASVSLLRDGSDLFVAVNQTVVQARVVSHFSASASQLDSIQFADGTVWDAQAIASRAVTGTSNAMTGTAGDDTFVVDHAGDTVNDTLGGVDTVQASVSHTLAANIENLTLGGYFDLRGLGNSGANVLTGNAGDNLLDGQVGADTLIGGTGDDTYRVGGNGDLVVEGTNAGTDTVIAENDYTMPVNVENLEVSTLSYRPLQAIGNVLDNTITVTNSYWGNVIDGGGGADTLIFAGLGGAVFYVDNVGDRLVAGSADHTVVSSIDWTLAANMRALQLTGSAAYGAGNASGNLLIGNGQADQLHGLGGNDTLYGNVDPSFVLPNSSGLVTTSWNAIGVDSLIGGSGNDTYHVHWSGIHRDVVVENAGEGTDAVVIDGDTRTYSVLDFANVENLSLAAAGASGLIGGAGTNELLGNRESNLLDGGAGNDKLDDGGSGALLAADNDTLLGGAGDDTLVSWYGSDRLDGGAGNDRIDMIGTGGTGTIVFGRGHGADRVTLTGVNTGRGIVLNADLGPEDLQVLRSGRDLQLAFGQGDMLTLSDYFADTTSNVPGNLFGTLEFADGLRLDQPQLIARMLSGNSNQPTGGADLIFGSSAADVVDGLGGDDWISGAAGNDSLAGGDGNDTVAAGDGDDTLRGGAGGDTLRGGAGVDDYRFERGDGFDFVDDSTGAASRVTLGVGIATGDVVVSRAGNDLSIRLVDSVDRLWVSGFLAGTGGGIESLRFADGTLWDSATLREMATQIIGTAGDDVLSGAADADRMLGLGGNDTLTGHGGNDTIDGGSGADRMHGVGGDDSYHVDSGADTVVENAAEGTDTVLTTVTYTLPANVEVLTLLGHGHLGLAGNAGSNVLNGNDGNNALDGLAGADTMAGGSGDDSYVVDDVADQVAEGGAAGFDAVQSSVTYTLAANVETLTLTGTSGIGATGNASANTITGNSGANALTGLEGDDALDGTAGNDTMTGGLGNDSYLVDAAGDVVVEQAGEGNDSVASSVTHTLGANVEVLTLTGGGAINGTGNAVDNIIGGNAAANTLSGAAGADTLVGAAGNDVYVVDAAGDVVVEIAGGGTDSVQSSVTITLAANVESLTLTGTAAIDGTGNALANSLSGNSGANRLDGGAGSDTMAGGAGNDTYVVDDSADTVTEASSAGTDTVLAGVSLTLASNVERLTLTGSASLNATGNTLANLLIGNSSANVLSGGAGADTMVGAAGNDSYVVNSSADVVTELASEGIDSVRSSVTLTLATNVETLSLTGTTAISGTGNSLDNQLTGNTANNTLTGAAGDDTMDGRSGNDTLVGGAGDDTFVVNVAADVVTEAANAGVDTVRSTVSLTLANNLENLTLTGTSAINATGNALDNSLTGNSGSNVLAGAAGDDRYEGGAGNDTFTDVSTTSSDSYRWGIGSGLDALTDSGGALDHVDLFAGVTGDDLSFARVGNGLELSILGQADRLTIDNWYVSSANQIEEFRLGDGSKVLASEVQALIGAMAAFSAAPSTALTTVGLLSSQQIRHFGDVAMPSTV